MFLPVKSDDGALLPWEYMTAAAGTYQVGQLLNVSDGRLAALESASAETPPYLCMADTTLDEDGPLPVTRISRTRIYETQLEADAPSAAPGVRLQVAAGGLKAAEGDGAFELVSLEGTGADDCVRGRWV